MEITILLIIISIIFIIIHIQKYAESEEIVNLHAFNIISMYEFSQLKDKDKYNDIKEYINENLKNKHYNIRGVYCTIHNDKILIASYYSNALQKDVTNKIYNELITHYPHYDFDFSNGIISTSIK